MNPTLNHESLASLDLKVLAVQRTEAGQWWNFRNVVSPFSRLWLILNGQASVSHHGRKFILKPGQLHLVPPFSVHDCSCSRRLDHYHLHFISQLPTGIDLLSLLDCEFQIQALPETPKHFRRLEAIYPDRKLPCFDPAREEYRRFPAVAERAGPEVSAADWFEAKGILTLLLAPFLKTARSHEGTHARATRLFFAVQEYIHEHMGKPIVLGDLARVASLHPTYFSDRFQQLVGVRPLEYLMQRRIERAQFLLLTGPASVKQIAGEVGFTDAAYFTRVFTRHCGKSPSAYRTLHSH
jgi:AraC-like DNA-binding protein